MSKEKRRVPKLRFPGFTEDWEQRKLNEFLSVSNLKNTENKYNKKDVLSVSGDYGIVNQIEFQGRSFAGVSVSNYGVVEKGDIVYTKSPLKLNPYGIIKTNRINNGIVSTLYAIYKTKENCDSKFIEHYFNLDSRLNQYLKPLVNKGAKNDMKVSSENALVGEVCFPQITEQAMIADLLDRLDIYITLHQRKLDNLKLKKKALLQKLFPKNGERYPELRFSGFTDAWEQRKLLTVLNKILDYRGRTPKKLGLDWSPTGHLALSALNVKMGYVDKTVDAHYGDDHLYNVWMKDNDLYEGQVLFTTEAPMGNVAQVPDDNKYILSQRTIAFVPDRRVISDNFLAVVLSASKCQKSLINRASGGTAKGVSQKTLSEISLDIPQSLSEQDKVSELIKKLSKIITLHQRKLDHLKLQKKALLQQMFV